MPDFSRRRLLALTAIAIGASGLSAVPGESAGRPDLKTARHAATGRRAKPATTKHIDMPSLEAKAAELKAKSAEPTGVWTSGEQDRACFRGRRKLWQPGEGWVVKKVNLCP